jgi:hypothetical protein
VTLTELKSCSRPQALAWQLASANQRIMNLEMANLKLTDEKVAIEHAQTIIRNLDQVATCASVSSTCVQTLSLAARINASVPCQSSCIASR